MRGVPELRVLKTTLLIVILCLFSTTGALCAVGEAGPALLKMNYGSRLISMGGAFVGLADDPFYMDANPAGGQRDTLRVSILHQQWIEDVNHENIRFTVGFDRIFLGLGYTFLHAPFTHYDSFGEASGDYTLTEGFATANIGMILGRLSLGINAKFFHYHVPEDLYLDQDDYGLAADFGVLWRTNLLKTFIGPEPSFVLGASVKNVGFPELTGSDFKNFPTEVHVGSSYRLKFLLVSNEVVLPLYEPWYWCVGMEVNVGRVVFLNAGLQYKEENPMLGLGFGLRLRDLYLYTSYTPRVEFRNMFTVSMSYRLGETRKIKERRLAGKLFKTAYKLYEQGKYGEAEKVLNTILDMDRRNEAAIELLHLVRSMEELGN
jgi:hypothetical protein